MATQLSALLLALVVLPASAVEIAINYENNTFTKGVLLFLVSHVQYVLEVPTYQVNENSLRLQMGNRFSTYQEVSITSEFRKNIGRTA